jgi:hypothetical protein
MTYKSKSVANYWCRATVVVCAIAISVAGCMRARAGGSPDLGPSSRRETSSTGTITGKVVSAPGTVSRSEKIEPAASAGAQILVFDKTGKKKIASAIADRSGRFQVDVPPGAYLIESGATKQFVKVRAGQRTPVNFAVPNP